VYIRRIHLRSYGPFEDSGAFEFERGINLIVGQNNAGKTAVLRSLRPDWPNWPHRNLQRYRQVDLYPSKQEIELVASGDEVRRAILEAGSTYHWPVRQDQAQISTAEFRDEYLNPNREYAFAFGRQPGGSFRVDANKPGHGCFGEISQYHVSVSAAAPEVNVSGYGTGNIDSTQDIGVAMWMKNIFRFDAERLNIGRCPQQDTETLSPNASNLPAVLQVMRGRQPARFEKLVARIREVLPSIHAITPASLGTNETEILVWPTGAMDNPEHAFSLNDSGTGVAQVIAILTAVLTRTDSVIAIDEINSFLHPAAAKSLIRILRTEHNDHQYIISTHSAEVISASHPNTLYVIKRDGFESSAHALSTDNVDELRELSDLLGISIGDVFAADHVLWVEGRTEELCFPFLINHWDLQFPAGLVISPVAATGDFIGSRRDVELLFSVYERLSRVTLPLVRSVAFTFDSEDLSETEKTDLSRRADGQLLFLPARHLECFVLCAPAIADLINAYDSRAEPIDAATVQTEVARIGGDSKYKASAQWNGDIGNAEWSKAVDAAKLLGDVIQTLTEARVSFEKTRHTLELLQGTLRYDPDKLEPVREYLTQLLNLVDAVDS
jgi:predicted ATPase